MTGAAAATADTSYRLRYAIGRLGFYFSVAVIMAPALFVFLWMLSLSLKNDLDNTAYPPVFIPSPVTFANFAHVLNESTFGLYLWNSIVVSGGSTLIALALGIPAGYGIAKGKANGLAVAILIARMTPALSFLIPLYALFQTIGLVGTLWPLLITHLVITMPIVVYIMIGFFESLPGEIEEAARIDGCSVWQAFLYVAMPLARPGITVAAILAFINSWNNFIFGVILGGRTTRTMPAAVYNMLTFEQFAWGPLAAAALIVMAPVLILTLIIQREIIAGLASGGVK